MSEWKFDLGETATITASGENGLIIGRAEYVSAERCYLIRYVAGDGRATEQWWQESSLA